MRQFFRFWWLCIRNAFWGNTAFANDWQWLFGVPIASGVVVWFASLWGSDLTTGYPIANGMLAALGAFLVTWLVAFIIRLLNAPVVLFHEQKTRADLLQKEREKSLTQQIQLSFEPQHPWVDKLHRTNIPSGAPSSWYSVKVTNIRDGATAKGCTVELTNVEYRDGSGYVATQFSQPQRLRWALSSSFDPLDIPPNGLRLVNVFSVDPDHDQILIKWPVEWIAYESIFKKIGIYRLTIIAALSDGIGDTISLIVNWNGDWQTVKVEREK